MTIIEQILAQVKTLPRAKQVEALDFINFLCQREEERKKRIEESIQALAEMGTFADINDPVEWQREIRKDRPLPGREE